MRIDTARLSPAERLLWSHGVVEPDQIDLKAIANTRGARVVHRHLDGCEARLVASAEEAVISINTASGYEGRRRFSLAHELAHWICDRKTGSFQCAKEVIGPQNAEAKSVEAHANAYASQLILPDYLVVPWANGKRANLDVAKTLANDFNASLTAAAIKLTKRATTPVCIVCHSQSRLLWLQRNGAFPSELFVLGELHQETDAFGLAFGATNGLSRPRTEPANRWLSGGGAYRLMIESQSIKLPDGTVLTMISLAK
ncbi:MAG: ImmA/IrrE family metallo-endopeptidase [Metallibacterium scheffleri]|jgi:Zn-dependent peptidase ImmA (M78 family)|uniref:ImmA/IrrE family metallo-endopeptidase n=1 Tax=Metallibacterium scheffleri TaxID=993689 RepID=UPI0026F2BE7E|nr:ImmA/IrrE family metallo-endopeptidase [Metallibacterium scheffleri]MCK9366574.1 ImmA/IrrE family metallo-endopeptidase [Metallibacterium scheffleri]